MTIAFYDWDGTPIKQWPNWDGVIPQVNDYVRMHYGDYHEETHKYRVLKRIIDGLYPDKIEIYVTEEY